MATSYSTKSAKGSKMVYKNAKAELPKLVEVTVCAPLQQCIVVHCGRLHFTALPDGGQMVGHRK
ncbi:hypothetical protein N7448_011409 [Penicillium atrosanguineum]|uniref:Uncharacterized protein n=1 Tax=Penicillium atrosanguineum TaxID=1132637 RepID=A0A9W9GEU1_9EURO|nr:hypothetical protein N7448_011409 [Penicillium atrosanguineum]KAJ5318727.1 hypothetical protein N7476_005147 [Penicillium atrosanguineum]